MKFSLVLLALLLITIPVNAHAVSDTLEGQSIGAYELQFFPEPAFPAVGQEVHLDLFVKSETAPISSLTITGEVHLPSGTEAEFEFEEETGHYGAKYVFLESGDNEIHISIEGSPEVEFEVLVDAWDFEDSLIVSFMTLFLAGLLFLIYKDSKA